MKVPVTTEVHSRIHFVTVPVFPEDVCFLIMNWLICKCILAACWCLSTISNRRKGLIIITQLSWQRLVIPQGVFALLPLSWIQSAVDTALGKRQSDPLSMSCVNPTIALHKKKKPMFTQYKCWTWLAFGLIIIQTEDEVDDSCHHFSWYD